MSGVIQVSIRTPQGAAWQGTCDAARIPSTFGSFGVLPNHAPLTALTGDGVMAIRQDDDTLWFVVTSGIAEIGSNTITLLTDAVLQATDEVDASEKLDGIQANTL